MSQPRAYCLSHRRHKSYAVHLCLSPLLQTTLSTSFHIPSTVAVLAAVTESFINSPLSAMVPCSLTVLSFPSLPASPVPLTTTHSSCTPFLLFLGWASPRCSSPTLQVISPLFRTSFPYCFSGQLCPSRVGSNPLYDCKPSISKSKQKS